VDRREKEWAMNHRGDVSNRIQAAIALLKDANLIILEQHMNTCVKDAAKAKNGSAKIGEISMILEKFIG
jgi:CsoR family transcriptional regulator, copper-sensing transcriptional repressor